MDLASLQTLLNKTQVQEKPKFQASKDENFPVHQTPPGGKFLIYIPTTGYTVDKDGVLTFDPLKSLIHSTRNGNRYGKVRCISGIVEESMGYDGSCPLCEGSSVEFELAALKINNQQEINRYEGEELKALRRQHFSSMKIESSEEYITIPIIVIPSSQKDPFTPDITPENPLRGEFLTIKTERFEGLVKKALEGQPDAEEGMIAGFFWLLNYGEIDPKKETKEQKRDAGKNLSMSLILSNKVLDKLVPLIPEAEEIASKFTKIKALEVLTDLEFKTKDEITKLTDSLVDASRQALDVLKIKSAEVQAIEAPKTASADVASALSNFGK
jgi:hypothetical protein